ncbi:MAG: PqqD family protein [Armatimonadetes bacterium]|nr:PqqD family protein [Armatimonadota bacterium]MDE2207013.1 PqqD family protein [Armatimonadota bacterium]
MAARHLPFLKLRPPIADRAAALSLRPGRNSRIEWEQLDTGEVVLRIPVKEAGTRRTRFVRSLFHLPGEKRVELDEVGAFVWQLCDGANTVEQIVQQTGRQYKMNRREAEVSVPTFLQMLHERNFIAFYKKTGKVRR